MRIPSQFDDDNLYRKKIPRGESVKTFRKLIRLALGLALVVVVMLQAAKPPRAYLLRKIHSFGLLLRQFVTTVS